MAAITDRLVLLGRQAGAIMRHGAQWGADILFPPACPVCGRFTTQHGLLCVECFCHVQLIAEPCCVRCGVPFSSEGEGGADSVCYPCAQHPPLWHEARAAFVYDDYSRKLILPLKYSDSVEHAHILAPHLVRAGHKLLARAHCLAPVPLHVSRLRERKYNQAALMAFAVARRTGASVVPDLLSRIRKTDMLEHLSPDARRQALTRSVTVRPRYQDRVKGQSILLIDDVMTTGATARVCTQALLEAGAHEVNILVAARAIGYHVTSNTIPEEENHTHEH